MCKEKQQRNLPRSEQLQSGVGVPILWSLNPCLQFIKMAEQWRQPIKTTWYTEELCVQASSHQQRQRSKPEVMQRLFHVGSQIAEKIMQNTPAVTVRYKQSHLVCSQQTRKAQTTCHTTRRTVSMIPPRIVGFGGGQDRRQVKCRRTTNVTVVWGHSAPKSQWPMPVRYIHAT